MPEINISILTSKKKQQVWAWIKTNKPGLAALLANENFNNTKYAFDGQVLIDFTQDECNELGISEYYWNGWESAQQKRHRR